jgi:hypothetical protein
MSNAIKALPATPPIPAAAQSHASALSSTDVAYVQSLMGVTPALRMEQILLKTGVPTPAHLGPNVDVGA